MTSNDPQCIHRCRFCVATCPQESATTTPAAGAALIRDQVAGTTETQTSTPQPIHPAYAGHRVDTWPWRALINEWIIDAEIRRDALKAVMATLATVVLVAGIVFPGVATALGHLLAPVLSTIGGKIITGSTVVLGIGRCLWRRNRQR